MHDPDATIYTLDEEGERILAAMKADVGIAEAAKVRRFMWFVMELSKVMNKTGELLDATDEEDVPSSMETLAAPLREFMNTLLMGDNGEDMLLPPFLMRMAQEVGGMVAKTMGADGMGKLVASFTMTLGMVAGAFCSQADGGMGMALSEMFGLPWEDDDTREM